MKKQEKMLQEKMLDVCHDIEWRFIFVFGCSSPFYVVSMDGYISIRYENSNGKVVGTIYEDELDNVDMVVDTIISCYQAFKASF